jgi:peptide/nickel transport system substrate-binding protein
LTAESDLRWGSYLDKVIVPPDKAGDLFEMSWIGDNGDPDNHLYILLSGEQWPPAYDMGLQNDKLDRSGRRAPRWTRQAQSCSRRKS